MMNRVLRIAARDFIAVISTKGFIIGLLVMPALMALLFILGPRIFDDRNFQVEGEIAILDTTGAVLEELRNSLAPDAIAGRRLEEFRRGIAEAPEIVRGLAEAAVEQSIDEALGPAPSIALRELPAGADVEAEKAWLNEESGELRHTAMIVIHDDAVVRAPGRSEYGTYDMYVPPGLDDRVLDFIYGSLRDSIVNARMSARSLAAEDINAIVAVPRQRSVTVSQNQERETVGGFSFVLPVAFMVLMFMGIMTGGGSMLTSTIEEKSSRVVEVLLSAVSPMELMAGKLIGSIGVSFVAMGLYLALGLALLSSFALFNLFNPWLILYLLIFFTIGFFVVGSLMMAVGAAVNEMSEAQSLQMPLILIIMIPWLLWPAISRNPNSTLAVVVSFLPPLNTFGMLLRMASSQPPPYWQVWLSIGVGVASVIGTLWIAAKIFKIGLLMYGKPPDLKTLVRWVRAA
jgi:ABC-type Na+ efflux pump permease subunit